MPTIGNQPSNWLVLMFNRNRLSALGQVAKEAAVAAGDPMPLAEFVRRKGCSRGTVYNRLDIPKIKIGGRVYIPRSALDVKIRERRSFGKGGDA